MFREYAGFGNLPRTEAGAIDFAHDFFWKGNQPHRLRQLNVESYCLALSKVYTFGPTFARKTPTPRGISRSFG